MPQLEPSSYISQIFWLTVTFFGLWFLMSWFIIPRIAEVIDARRKKIDDYIQKAETINKKAMETLERYEKALQKANQDVASNIAHKKQEIAFEIEQKKNAFSRELASKIAENEYILAKDRKETLEAIDEVSVKSALAVLQKLNLKSNKTEDNLYELIKHKDI